MFDAAAVGSSTGSASVSLTAPTIAAHSRLVYVAVSDVDSLTWTAPSGFAAADPPLSITYDGQTLAVFEKKDADGTEGGTTLTATTSGQAFDKRCALYVFTGRDNSAALDFITPSSVNTPLSSPANLDATSGTASSGADALVVYALDKEAAANTWGCAAPSGYTERNDDDGTTWAQLAGYTKDNVSGALGTITAVATRSVGSGSTGYGAFVLAIPAAAGSTGPTITGQLSDAHVADGATANFTSTATASGGGTLSYQVQRNGVDVSTGTGYAGSGGSCNFTTAALALSDDGAIYTVVWDETGGSNDGTVTSSAATLRVGVIHLATGAPAYSAAGGSTVAPAYPTVAGGIQAGDQLVCIVALKPPTASPNTGTVTTPTTGGTWNRPAERTAANDGNTGGYSTTIAADTGNVGAFSFDLVASGGESGTMTVSLGGTGGTGNAASVAWAAMAVFRKPPGSTWSSVVGSTGKRTQDTTPSAGVVSEVMAADPGVTAGDYILFTMAIPTDVNGGTTWSGQAVTQTGVTYETAVETAEPFTGNGDDIGGFVAISRALSGTSSAAPTVGATKGGTTTNARGPILFLRLRAGSSSSPPGISTETDAGLALAAQHAAAVGLAAETDTALALSAARRAQPGLASEADTALALVSTHTASVGLATETETALTLTASHVASAGVATETDAALGLVSVHSAAPGAANDTSAALALSGGVPGVAVETESALALATTHAAQPGVASETENALALAAAHLAQPGFQAVTETALALASQHVAPVAAANETNAAIAPGNTTPGVATENDAAVALSASHAAVVSLASEAETALTLSSAHLATPGVASEADAALVLAATHAASPGVAPETEAALGLGASHVAQVGVASTTDAAFALAAIHVAAPGVATELDSALVPGSGATAPGIATETDASLVLSSVHSATAGLASSANTALAPAASHVAAPSVATETNAAFARSSTHVAVPGIASETAASVVLGATHIAAVGLATEADSALANASAHVAPAGVAAEAGAAFALPSVHVAPPGLASETDAAVAPVISAPPGVATETSGALGLGSQHVAPPGVALDSSDALVLATVHVAPPAVAAENDTAFEPAPFSQYGRVTGTFGRYPATPTGTFGYSTTPRGTFGRYATAPTGRFGDS